MKISKEKLDFLQNWSATGALLGCLKNQQQAILARAAALFSHGQHDDAALQMRNHAISMKPAIEQADSELKRFIDEDRPHFAIHRVISRPKEGTSPFREWLSMCVTLEAGQKFDADAREKWLEELSGDLRNELSAGQWDVIEVHKSDCACSVEDSN